MAWLHLRPCSVPSWCGASRTIWDCCWSWGISGPPRAAAPVTLPKKTRARKWANEWVCRPTLTLSIFEIVPKHFCEPIALKSKLKLCHTVPYPRGVFDGLSPSETMLQSHPSLNMKHYATVMFVQISECQAQLHNYKAPLACKKTFWWRCCCHTMLFISHFFGNNGLILTPSMSSHS